MGLQEVYLSMSFSKEQTALTNKKKNAKCHWKPKTRAKDLAYDSMKNESSHEIKPQPNAICPMKPEP